MKISIIIPVYNAERWLPRLLCSLQAQEGDWEALFTDDGSSDGSLRILREAERKDQRIRVFEIAHEGSSGARNKGLDNASGDIIAFIDADDFIHPELTKTVLPYFDDASVDAVMYDFLPVEPDAEPRFSKISIPLTVTTLADPIKWALYPWKPTAHGVWRTFYRRSIIGEIRFFPKIKHQDLLFSYQVWGKIGKMLKLDCTLYAYVQTPDSVIRSDYSVDKIEANFIIMSELYKYYFNRVNVRHLLRRRLFSRRVKEVWKQVSKSEALFSGPMHRAFFENLCEALGSGLISLWLFLPYKTFIFQYGIFRFADETGLYKIFFKVVKQVCKIVDIAKRSCCRIIDRIGARLDVMRVNKAIASGRYKYVHLLYHDKFSVPFVEFLNRNFPTDEHLVLSRRLSDHKFPTGENVLEIRRFKGLDLKSEKIEKIICHSLFDTKLVDFLYVNKALLQKAYWVMWGGDLYNAPRDEKNDFVRKNLCGYINKIDMEYALSKYGMKGQFFHCSSMFPTLKLEVPKAKAHDGVRVQINNSCDGSTLEMLDILSKFKDENVVITTVLSYGDMKFRDAIIEKGRSIFGKKFEFLDRYLSSKEYAIWQNSNDVLVLNQRRQQGLGNTLFALKSGIKVYLRSDVSTFKYISENGGCVFDTLAISGMLWQSFVEYLISDRTRSVNFVMDNYKEKRMAEEWNNVFLYLN